MEASNDDVFERHAKRLRPDSGVLVVWSGGMDSTLVLWKVLHLVPESVPVIAYHVEFNNFQRRGQAESLACREIVNRLRADSSTPRDFVFSENAVTVDTHRCPTWPIVATLAGLEAEGRDCAFIADGRRDYVGSSHSRSVVYRQWERTLRLYREMACEPIFYFPVLWHTKEQVRAALPDFLADAMWSCRMPGYGEGKFVPCGVCGTCRDYQTHGIDHPTIAGEQKI